MPHSSQIPPEQRQFAEDPQNRVPASLPMKLLVVCTVLFTITVLAMTTLMLSGERTPVNNWLDRHIGEVVGVEFAAIGACLILAIISHRREKWKEYERQLAAFQAKLAETTPDGTTQSGDRE